MTENSTPGTKMIVPAFRHCKALSLDMVGWSSALSRLHEVQNLVPSNYTSLEFTMQEAWREAKRNAIQVGDAVKRANQNIEEIKADIILDEIPKLLEEKNLAKSANNADFRKAVMAKSEDYKNALIHLEKLESMLLHFESHMKMMENTSRFMKKQMDYIIRNGSYGG